MFLYSDEEGTGAFDLDGKVPRRTAVAAAKPVDEDAGGDLEDETAARWLAGAWKSCSKALPSESELLLKGRMETQAPDIDGHVLINDTGERSVRDGEFYQVEITESMEYDLIGRIVP